MHDNISVDSEFEAMTGYFSSAVIDECAAPEVRLFQEIALHDILHHEETPQEFFRWARSEWGTKICLLANLDLAVLERAMKKYNAHRPNNRRRGVKSSILAGVMGVVATNGSKIPCHT